MRFVLVGLIAAAVIGSVWAFSRFQSVAMRQSVARHAAATLEAAIELEVDATFPPSGDAFGGQPVEVLVNGVALPSTPQVGAGQFHFRIPLSVRWRDDINRVYLRVGGAAEADGPSRAVHARLWQGEIPLAEKVAWSPPGEPVAFVLHFDPSQLRGDDHD